MSRRQFIFLLLAILIATGTVLGAHALLTGNDAPVAEGTVVAADPENPPVEILVAKKDVPTGSFLGEDDVEWKSWPAASKTDAMIVKGQAEEKSYIGAVARSGLRTGEPIITGRILKSDQHGFLSAVLAPGMRAMTVKITPVSGVAGFIFPNDMVDVILAHDVQRTDDTQLVNRHVSETVLDGVRVLALDQKTDDQNTQPKTAELATLEVTPKQAEKLALVAQMGNLSLVIRSLASNVAPVAPVADLKKNETSLPPQLLEAAQHAMPKGTAAPLPGSSGPRDITWDSDVSLALPAPMDKSASQHHVQIFRGSTASDVTFGGVQ